MHALLQNKQAFSPAVLILAVSGRALATAARRAGYRPFVADLFNDSDTLELAERALLLRGSLRDGVNGEHLAGKLRDLTAGEKPVALIYGSGFEQNPDLVDYLAGEFPLAGNNGATIRLLKDPKNLARICHENSIPHPEITFDPPPSTNGWVTKMIGGSGGSHVQLASDTALRTNQYFQRFVSGKNLSVLFIAQSGKAHIVGFSRQWASSSGNAPFRYGGAVRLSRLSQNKRERIEAWMNAITNQTGMVGLCSADFIESHDDLHLIEINPRPGATLDIFDSEDHPLLSQHIRAVSGEKITLPVYRDAMASTIAYTDRPIAAFPQFVWPSLTADRQNPGTTLEAGDPVCTIIAKARTAAEAELKVKKKSRALAKYWEREQQ